MPGKQLSMVLGSLPPDLRPLDIDPDGKVLLQLDQYLAEKQPALHDTMHSAAERTADRLKDELPRNEDGKIVLSDTQLRGCLAAVAIDAGVSSLLQVGQNLQEAFQLEAATIPNVWDDPASAE